MSIISEILVVVPARGGSKRVKNKNIRLINNKPMIKWTLNELLKVIDKNKIIISTDDEKTKRIVEEVGLKVPFTRPAEISDDFTPTQDVAKHALNWYEKNNSKIKYTLIIYPTAILLKHVDLLHAYNFMKKNSSCSVFFTAGQFSHPIERAFRLDNKKQFKMINPKFYKKRTQDFEKAFYDAGQFYLCKSEIIRNSKPLFNKNSNFIVLKKNRFIDIDDEDDLELAETLLKSYTQ